MKYKNDIKNYKKITHAKTSSHACEIFNPYRLWSCLIIAVFIFFQLGTEVHALDLVSKIKISPKDSSSPCGINDECDINGTPMIMESKEDVGGNKVRFATVFEDNHQIKYFIKKERLETHKIPIFFDAIFASRVLNLVFSGGAQRFPFVTLGIDTDDNNKLYTISEELKGYKTVYDIFYENQDQWPFASDNIPDIETLYVALYLIGSGDPHPKNIVFSLTKSFFGDVDLDVAFKNHTSYQNPAIKSIEVTPISYNLALRDFSCTDPCANFLFVTDSLPPIS